MSMWWISWLSKHSSWLVFLILRWICFCLISTDLHCSQRFLITWPCSHLSVARGTMRVEFGGDWLIDWLFDLFSSIDIPLASHCFGFLEFFLISGSAEFKTGTNCLLSGKFCPHDSKEWRWMRKVGNKVLLMFFDWNVFICWSLCGHTWSWLHSLYLLSPS